MTIDFGITNIILLVATGLVTFYVGWLSCLRSGFSIRALLMESFRFAIIGLAAFTLCQPTFVIQTEHEGSSIVKVLIDDSGSMTTEDVQEDEKLLSRAAAAASLSQQATWENVKQDHIIEISTFASGHLATSNSAEITEGVQGDGVKQPQLNQSATNIYQALSGVASNPKNVNAVVLVSDGDWNMGQPPAEAARKLRQLGIPVHTIGTGSPASLPDLALTNFNLPTFAIVGKPLRIPFAVTSTLNNPVDVNVKVNLPEGDQRTVSLQVPANGTAESVVSWRPTAIGSFHISAEVPVHADERVIVNNEQTLPINVRYESLSVLMIDSYPRWEYRYTRNALMRDPGVTVNTLLLHPDLPEDGDGPGYLDSFPSTEELSKYDVVFLGDVGIGPTQLTEKNCDELVQLVRNHASGLIFLPGFRGFQSTLAESKLEELLPVEMDWKQPKGIRSTTVASFRLTESGSESLLTRLETNVATNTEVWNSLPGFYWHAAVERAKPNTNVLAVHSARTNRYGRLPLIVTRTFGTGKVLFVGSDSAWRWRKGIEDLYHYRFWSQMVRWMSYQRTMAAGKSMRMIFTPDRPKTGDTIYKKAIVSISFISICGNNS